MEVDLDRSALRDYGWTAIWAACTLLGPVPWVLLATAGLTRIWGMTGYSIAFVAAPALWTGLCLAALLVGRRRGWTVAWAMIGAVWWYVIGF